MTEELHPSIITVCGNCGLHLDNIKPYIEKIKLITCSSCVHKISATDLNKKYKKEGLKKHAGFSEFSFGLYCLMNTNKYGDPATLFDGLKIVRVKK